MAKAVDYNKIESELKNLTTGIIVKSDFLFELLKIYSFSANQIKSLRSGNGLSHKPGQYVLRNKLLFEECNVGLLEQNLTEAFEALRVDPIVEKYKIHWDFFLTWLGHEKFVVQEENRDVASAEKMVKIYDEIVKTYPNLLLVNTSARSISF